jgi:hypothetical protein
MSKPKKLSPGEKAFFIGLLLIGVVAGLFFRPLWLVYLAGGVFWFA